MTVYDNFEEFKEARRESGDALCPSNVIAAVADALGEPYEIELGI
jgi:hypothetical protein